MERISLGLLDRRRFLRGSGVALALPLLRCAVGKASDGVASPPKRLACFYQPDGVPMPLPEDPAFNDWSWFPHGSGREFTFSKVMEPLAPLRDEMTILSGFSHPAVRSVHGHSNADQFLTAANTGANGPYKNSISMDQVYAAHIGDQTRFASLVMSTDGGTGTSRGAHTLSFDRHGRAIPAEHRPKRVFDMLFVKSDQSAVKQLQLSKSVLDDLLEDANDLRRTLSPEDKATFDEYLQSVRDTEVKVEKAKRWTNIPLPTVEDEHLNLDITMDDPKVYLQTMFEVIYLAFKTDSTRVATYQMGRENAIGISDYMARAVGLQLAHQLSHETTEPGGWERFGIYCRFINQELARFIERLKTTPEPSGEGSMLDHTLVFFGSASSAFHLSRNYPLILAGGKQMGFQHGQYLNYAGLNFQGGPWAGGQEPWQKEVAHEDQPLSNLFVTMLQRLGVQTDRFADSTAAVDEV